MMSRFVNHHAAALAWIVIVIVFGVGRSAAADAPRTGGSELALDKIQNAIRHGIQYLYSSAPSEMFEQAWKYTDPQYTYDHGLHHAMGNHALAIWALLAAGESYQNPVLYRRLHIVLTSDVPYIFDRGMRAQMLAELPHRRWAHYVHRDGVFLKAAVTDMGNFAKSFRGTPLKGAGDNAHGQYGVLGLAGLQRAGWSGIKLSDWERIDRYW